jgi:hypothetical protein
VHDCAAKITLLQRETAFNDALAGSLETLQVVAGLLDSAQDGLLGDDGDDCGEVEGVQGRGRGGGDLSMALEKVVQAEKVLGTLGGFAGARFVAILGRRVGSVREEIVGEVRGVWGRLVSVDGEGKKICVRREMKGKFFF